MFTNAVGNTTDTTPHTHSEYSFLVNVGFHANIYGRHPASNGGHNIYLPLAYGVSQLFFKETFLATRPPVVKADPLAPFLSFTLTPLAYGVKDCVFGHVHRQNIQPEPWYMICSKR